MKAVLIVGLGQIGKALSKVVKPKYRVQMKDLAEKTVFKPIDVMHVCYGWDRNFVQATIDYMKKYEPALTIIESTVLPGTTRMIWKETNHMSVCHSPVRGRHQEGLENGLLKYTKFIGGIVASDAEKAEKYYNSLGLKTCVCKNALTTEFIKILSTTYYGLMIAFFQEIQRICFEHDVNDADIKHFFLTSTVESSFQHLRPVFYASAIEGHCVMANLKLLNQVFPSKFVDIIVQSNEETRRIGHE